IANVTETVAQTLPVLQGAVDDTNEAPWMTMPEFQYFVARLLVGILRLHAERRNLGWHVTGELSVITPKPEVGTLTLGPDVLVVEADGRLRDSWDVRQEGKPPRLVLEIVTHDSVERDTVDKPGYYAQMGVEEYVLFWPERKDGGPKLFGYHRDNDGTWVEWAVDAAGVLRSAVLHGLGLQVGEHPWLRVVDEHGARLPSPEEEAARAEREAARALGEAARAEREAARAEREAARAAAAEAELARLRTALERQQG
ncbi:MAG TPA: Uma2 family endonuclease, partial [Chloroflexota bacterium]